MENAKMRKTAVVTDKILKVLQGVAAALRYCLSYFHRVDAAQ